jgi:hypothetical protein
MKNDGNGEDDNRVFFLPITAGTMQRCPATSPPPIQIKKCILGVSEQLSRQQGVRSTIISFGGARYVPYILVTVV